MSLHEKMKQIGDIKSVYMMSLKFGIRSGKCNPDWITGWICWKFHDIGGTSDLSEEQTQAMKQEDLHRNSLLPCRYFVTLNHC